MALHGICTCHKVPLLCHRVQTKNMSAVALPVDHGRIMGPMVDSSLFYLRNCTFSWTKLGVRKTISTMGESKYLLRWVPLCRCKELPATRQQRSGRCRSCQRDRNRSSSGRDPGLEEAGLASWGSTTAWLFQDLEDSKWLTQHSCCCGELLTPSVRNLEQRTTCGDGCVTKEAT